MANKMANFPEKMAEAKAGGKNQGALVSQRFCLAIFFKKIPPGQPCQIPSQIKNFVNVPHEFWNSTLGIPLMLNISTSTDLVSLILYLSLEAMYKKVLGSKGRVV